MISFCNKISNKKNILTKTVFNNTVSILKNLKSVTVFKMQNFRLLKTSISCFLFLTLTLQSISTQITNTSAIIDQEIQEVLTFSSTVIGIVEEYIRNALPLEAQLDGEQILQHVKEGLQNCENSVKIPADIWQYKVCSSAILRDGMAALAALQQKYRPYSTSSASRIKLFW